MSTVLVVDDSETVRRMVEETLMEAGFQVVTACDGVQGLQIAREGVFELVLTDLHMPRMDGISLVRELRALPRWRYTPILILTTESAPEMKARGREVGATGWLVKPFDPLRLLATIQRVLA
ncbi:MAG: response regulator [Armatimonadetes bacterium]|nr:response regulator [Armatimonadota bacterium]